MRQHSLKIASSLIVLFLLTFLTQPVKADTNWKHFSLNLEKALKSDNIGLQQSAMFLVIKYGNKVDVRNALTDVMKLYKNNKDEQVRELALLTIFQMDRKKALELLNKKPNQDFKAFINKRLEMYLTLN